MSVEATIERMARQADPAAVARARAAFEEATGAFAAGEPWYEERISAFFDFALASFEGGALARTFATRIDVSDDDRAIAASLPRAERSVFRVARAAEGVVCEGLYGARFRLGAQGVAARLRGGERFDGRIVSVGGVLELMPGAVFHPAETHEAIDALLAAVSDRGAPESVRTQTDLADALLRMRMRFDRFTSMNARHVYRYEALAQREILVASWARPEARGRGERAR